MSWPVTQQDKNLPKFAGFCSFPYHFKTPLTTFSTLTQLLISLELATSPTEREGSGLPNTRFEEMWDASNLRDAQVGQEITWRGVRQTLAVLRQV